MPSGFCGDRIQIRTERPRTAAVRAAERERHALRRRALRVGHLRQRIEMRVEIDESRRDDQSARIDRAFCRSRRDAAAFDANDAIADDRDVAAISRRSGAVDDRPVRDDDVVLALPRAVAGTCASNEPADASSDEYKRDRSKSTHGGRATTRA